MKAFKHDIVDNGRLIPLTSLVFITSGMNVKDIPLVAILVSVPSNPHIDIGRRSKLNI